MLELSKIKNIACIFADPPDNIGLQYAGFKDANDNYESWLEDVMIELVDASPMVWLSYNSKHWATVGNIVHDWDIEIKQFIQTFTFGQNCSTDCGNGHRPLLRLRQNAPLYPDAIKVPSQRQLSGDKRAAPGGKVPLDVWDFPRVTGNSKQRRPWHPTQLNEGLVERAILMSTKEGDLVVDPFGGSGTTLRVCKRLNRDCILIEKSETYYKKLCEEHDVRN